MCGAADQRARPDDVAGGGERQIVLAQMQHVGSGGAGDVRVVVDRKQRAVAARRIGENLKRRQFGARLERAELLLTGRSLVSRSWMMSTPPASAASANSARSPRSRRASVHRYSLAPASRT